MRKLFALGIVAMLVGAALANPADSQPRRHGQGWWQRGPNGHWGWHGGWAPGGRWVRAGRPPRWVYRW
jgi:hypothetical protein